MCRCTPGIRTPFCGKPDCEWPEPLTKKEWIPVSDKHHIEGKLGCNCSEVISFSEGNQLLKCPVCSRRYHIQCYEEEVYDIQTGNEVGPQG